MVRDDIRVLYARATFGEEEKAAVNDVLENPEELVGGEYTDSFQDRVSDLFGQEHGIMVNSGSSANLLAISALDLPRGSEVITPALTFSTTVAPLFQNDLRPVFVDVGIGDYQIRVGDIESAVTQNTKAMMVPSLIGNVPDLPGLRDIADEHGLYLIEDSADTIGARFGGKPTGYYSDVSTTSFYGSHVITGFGSGGMACTDDAELKERMTLLRGWGRRSSVKESEDIETRYQESVDGIPYDSKFLFDAIGYNFLPMEASAAFGLEQVKKLETFSRKRNDNFHRLRTFFENYDDQFILPRQMDEVETNWLAFPLTVTDDARFDRREIVTFLERNGIQTRPIFSGNILRHPGFRSINHKQIFDGFPNADKIMESSFLIGCHQSMGETKINHVEETINRFFNG